MSASRRPPFDSTLSLLREGYPFIWKTCRRLGRDLFVTRFFGERTVCIHGAEAARLFYDNSRFRRRDAVPRRVLTSLFGKGAVHTLDDSAHRNRKAMFMSLMTPASMGHLMDYVAQAWRGAVRRWERADSVVLLDEVQQVLCRAACAWTGVPIGDEDVPRVARDLAAMVDAFGGVGPRLWRGKRARRRAERWMAATIEEARSGRLRLTLQSPTSVIARHRDHQGRLLDARVAAVELINVLRPTVAIAWYIVFAALALAEYPWTRHRLESDLFGMQAGSYADLFMQEVRRFFPFAPFLGARARAPFEWRGHHFEPGRLVLLDVYGTNHDPLYWKSPDQFRPERFADWEGDRFSFIPQGGGDRGEGHRCPGEWITMHTLTLAIHFLTRGMTYDVAPGQDLTVDLTRMPTQPRSGFVIRNVRAELDLDLEVPPLPSARAIQDSP